MANKSELITQQATWLQQTGLSEGLIAALIIGGLGLIGIIIKYFLDRREERKKFLRGKYEELVFRLVDFSVVVKEYQSQRFVGESNVKALDLSKFSEMGAKVEILAVLYFPQLEEECKYFLQTGADLIIAQHQLNLNNDVVNEINLEDRAKVFDDAYDSFYTNIKRHIHKYT